MQKTFCDCCGEHIIGGNQLLGRDDIPEGTRYTLDGVGMVKGRRISFIITATFEGGGDLCRPDLLQAIGDATLPKAVAA